MNGRMAKALRRQARAETAGQPERRLVHSHQVANKKDHAINPRNTTRGLYLALKKTFIKENV